MECWERVMQECVWEMIASKSNPLQTVHPLLHSQLYYKVTNFQSP